MRLLSAAAVAKSAPLGDHDAAVICEIWPLNPFWESQSLLATVWKSTTVSMSNLMPSKPYVRHTIQSIGCAKSSSIGMPCNFGAGLGITIE
jgi:hypothetical protein